MAVSAATRCLAGASHGVGYIVGLAKNKRLNRLAASWMETAEKGFAASGVKQRGSLTPDLELIAEHGPKGANPRYIVTNLEGGAQELYEKLYCARGDMENRIKESRSLRRSHQLPQVVAQPVPAAALEPRLHAA